MQGPASVRGDGPQAGLRNLRAQEASMETVVLARFADLGVRATHPRRSIARQLGSMAVSGADFSAQELWIALRQRDPSVGRATVYRAVELLASDGLLDRLPAADGTQRYRLCSSQHHHHLTCASCQRVVEVDVCLPPGFLEAVAQTTDFSIDHHSLELFGRCAECRESPDGARRDDSAR